MKAAVMPNYQIMILKCLNVSNFKQATVADSQFFFGLCGTKAWSAWVMPAMVAAGYYSGASPKRPHTKTAIYNFKQKRPQSKTATY